MDSFEVAVIDEHVINSGEDIVASIRGVRFILDPEDPEVFEKDFEMSAIASLIYGKREYCDASNDDRPLGVRGVEFGNDMIAYFSPSFKKNKNNINPMAMMIVYPNIFKSADIDMMELSKNIKKANIDNENLFLFGKVVIAKVGPSMFKPVSINVESFMKDISDRMTDVTSIIKAGKKITDAQGNIISVENPSLFKNKGIPGFSNN
jgi:hypothetical protein